MSSRPPLVCSPSSSASRSTPSFQGVRSASPINDLDIALHLALGVVAALASLYGVARTAALSDLAHRVDLGEASVGTARAIAYCGRPMLRAYCALSLLCRNPKSGYLLNTPARRRPPSSVQSDCRSLCLAGHVTHTDLLHHGSAEPSCPKVTVWHSTYPTSHCKMSDPSDPTLNSISMSDQTLTRQILHHA